MVWGFFELLDHLAANILMPLGGLFIAIFAGWFMKRDASYDELAIQNHKVYMVWRFLIRYITPILILLVFLDLIEIY